MPEKFLFVSHVSEDRAAALEIVKELEARGVRCWIAPRNVRPGRPFDDEIADAIEGSQAMLLIFSSRCNDSEYIRREVTVAGESQKVVIPFRIENAQPKHGLRVRLSDLHWLDGFASRQMAIDELVSTFPPIAPGADESRGGADGHELGSGVAARQNADEQRTNGETDIKRREEEKRDDGPARPPPTLKSRSALVAVLLIGVAALGGIGAWLFMARPTPLPTAQGPGPTPPAAVAPLAAATCKPATASFHDDFHKQNPGWSFTSTDREHYADGQLVLMPPPVQGVSARYSPSLYENATICANIKSPAQIKTPDGTAGVIFWSVNNDNYYVAQIMPDGTYTIDRKFAGTWISLVPRTPNERIARGANAVNEVGIVLADNIGALFINKAKVQEFRGQPPTGGASIGLHAESETGLADDWRFLDIVVMDNGKSKPVVPPPSPSGPTIADCRPVNPGDFQDTFTKPDPGWGLGDPATFYIDSQLSLKPDEDAGLKALYLPLVFKNVTLCATVKFPNQAVDLGEDAPNGGLAFWASDLGNLYKAAIFPNGSFNVARMVNNEWRMVVPRTMSDAIKKGIGAVNELQVVLNNNTGLFYINGVQVREFRGQPPKNGGAIGLYAHSETHGSNDWRFLKITVVENQ